MTGPDLDAALQARYDERRSHAAPARLAERVGRIPVEADERAPLRSLGGRWHGLFGATRLAVAGVIVALFGGLLLAGVVLGPNDDSALIGASPSFVITDESTSIRSDLIDGVDLQVEELEPGVFRVVSDGYRQMRWDAVDRPYSVTHGAIVVGPTGDAWSFLLPEAGDDDCETEDGGAPAGCMAFYRLGDPRTHRMADGSYLQSGGIEAGVDPVGLAPDGTIWAITRSAGAGDAEERLRVFDGERWTDRRRADAVAVARDGRVWAKWKDRRGRGRVGYLTDDGWTVAERFGSRSAALIASAEGSVHLVYTFADDLPIVRLEHPELPPIPRGNWNGETLVHAGGGAFWWEELAGPDEPDGAVGLVRHDGTEATVFDDRAVVGLGKVLGVGLDGAAWLGGQIDGRGCDGIHRFDGSAARHFLAGTCPASLDVAPDGSIWLQVTDGPGEKAFGWVDTVVITPAAWAAEVE